MKNQAFTLIELLVVVLIIGILAAIAVPQYQMPVLKSKYAHLQIYVKAIYEAEVSYYLANNTYTNNLEDLDISLNTPEDIVCSVQIEDNDLGCQYQQNGIWKLYYITKIGGAYDTQRRCFARSLNTTDMLNKICKNETGQEPYRCSNGYCAYKYN